MEERYCAEFINGRCKIPVGSQTPSLSVRMTEVLEIRESEIILTDRNDIYDFIGFYDSKILKSVKIPEILRVIRRIPVRGDYYKCTAGDCGNKQSQCNCYK